MSADGFVLLLLALADIALFAWLRRRRRRRIRIERMRAERIVISLQRHLYREDARNLVETSDSRRSAENQADASRLNARRGSEPGYC